ncbi:unnamed protein product, partial [Cyprideis torosa]
MSKNVSKIAFKLKKFQKYFEGDILTDISTRAIYSQDASLYKVLPIAIIYPKVYNDVKIAIKFAKNNNTSIIARTAGTSLSGQCVGESIILDYSRYLTKIIEINPNEKYAIVEAGVIRDELNIALQPHNLIFGPNTSTSNRAMIGGMVGNNSSGSYSIKYQTTRENVLEINGYLSDGSEALVSTKLIMNYNPNLVELMDKAILDCTKYNITQNKNRFFIKGDPEAILMIELDGEDEESLKLKSHNLIKSLDNQQYIYDYSILYGNDIKRAFDLRASGLGVLMNTKSEDRPVEFVEDTAVDIEDLPNYIKEFKHIMESKGTEGIYYAHAGAGEIHIRPKVNLKIEEGRQKFREIALATAKLVKKYKGSLSGEHGDGIVRSPYIEYMVGSRNYELFKRIKSTWDPFNIFNPGKIVGFNSNEENLKYKIGNSKTIPTNIGFEEDGGIIKALERCTGSGDCRKTESVGGVMCPSYQATKDERDSTRARAVLLRDYYQGNYDNSVKIEDAVEILELCLGCKACKSECPSSVDMASIKTEVLTEYYNTHKPKKHIDRMANYYDNIKIASKFSSLYNLAITTPLI